MAEQPSGRTVTSMNDNITGSDDLERVVSVTEYEDAPSGESETQQTLPGRWYVVTTLSGHENKAETNLRGRIASLNLEGDIYEIRIPMETVTEFKKGKKVTVERKLFPGYLLIRCEMNDEVWFCIRQTPSVTGFVGQVQKNQRPPALTRREEKEFLLTAQETAKKTRIIAEEWLEGEAVRITDGPFKDFTGVVQENDPAQNKLKVLVNIFGRETLVEMGADQVTR